MKAPIYQGLSEYIKNQKNRFASPAHRGKIKMKAESLTRLDLGPSAEVGDVINSKSFMADGENLIADIFGADKSFYLTGGSDSGIYAALASVCKAGDKIILDPECDKAFINAVTMLALIPVFLKRKYSLKYGISGGIDTEELEYLTERYKDAKMVVITSPTYYGVCANIKKAIEIAHAKKMLLMVDESHGAHFNFESAFPETALQCGADVVVHNISKTLGGFTGNGLLHIKDGAISEKSIREQLSIYQGAGSSFAYVCIAENAILYAFKKGKKYLPILREIERGKFIINHTTEIMWFDTEYNNGANVDETDQMKIVLNVSKIDMSVQDVVKILETKYGIVPEAIDRDNIIFSVSLYNTPSEVRKLVDSCAAIGRGAKTKVKLEDDTFRANKRKAVKVLPYKAFNCEGESVHYIDAEGRLLRKPLFKHPQGSAIAVPGEKLTADHIATIGEYLKSGAIISGIDEMHHIEVLSLSDSFGI